MTGDLAAAVEQIAADPAVLGLGDLGVLRVLPSCRGGQASLRLEDPAGATLYVAEVRLGLMDDGAIIILVERWATERRRYANRQCFAVLTAEQIEPRYVSILGVISRAVQLPAMEMHRADGPAQFTLLVSVRLIPCAREHRAMFHVPDQVCGQELSSATAMLRMVLNDGVRVVIAALEPEGRTWTFTNSLVGPPHPAVDSAIAF